MLTEHPHHCLWFDCSLHSNGICVHGNHIRVTAGDTSCAQITSSLTRASLCIICSCKAEFKRVQKKRQKTFLNLFYDKLRELLSYFFHFHFTRWLLSGRSCFLPYFFVRIFLEHKFEHKQSECLCLAVNILQRVPLSNKRI